MEKLLSLEVLNNVSEIDIIYKKRIDVPLSQRPQITTSRDAYEILLHYWDSSKLELLEEFKVLLLNKSNRVMQLFNVASGGITGTVADPRLILAAALKVAATGMIISHNHPSGGVKPSRADEELTLKIKEAARVHDIVLLDHVIVTSEGYYSFADEGLL